jgi:hypothetical protein
LSRGEPGIDGIALVWPGFQEEPIGFYLDAAEDLKRKHSSGDDLLQILIVLLP